MTDSLEPKGVGSTRWGWRGTALGALLLGWIFIAWQNHFHVTAPLVFVCLAYLAVVATVYNLFRTGAAAVASGDDDGDSTWAKQTGALGELEREKRTLLKAIKEAEFDHQMGKLSKRDVDEMIRVYRARAIEVIKEIDQLGAGTGSGGTTREQIMREVRARIELDAKAHKRAEPAKAAESAAADKRKGKDKDKKRGNVAAKADEAASRAANSAASAESTQSAESAESATAANRAAEAHAQASDERADRAASAAERASSAAASLDDEAMDADSTTAVESTREHRAKEATP
jgi:membrane protein involved in colicin uptake